mgnify:CR=1 FL=1
MNSPRLRIFRRPNLAVGDVGTITLNYYLVNEDGITINGTGEAIDFERRQQLGTKLYWGMHLRSLAAIP